MQEVTSINYIFIRFTTMHKNAPTLLILNVWNSLPNSIVDLHRESKKGATLTMAITLSILDRFAKFFHCCKQQ